MKHRLERESGSQPWKRGNKMTKDENVLKARAAYNKARAAYNKAEVAYNKAEVSLQRS